MTTMLPDVRITMDDTISRRRAAKLIGATAASAFLPIGTSRIYAADESRMLMRSIPSTGEKLPVIGLGSATTFDQLQGVFNAQGTIDVQGSDLFASSPQFWYKVRP